MNPATPKIVPTTKLNIGLTSTEKPLKHVIDTLKSGIIESNKVVAEGGKTSDSGTMAESQTGTGNRGSVVPDNAGNETVRSDSNRQSKGESSTIPAEEQKQPGVPEVGAKPDTNSIGRGSGHTGILNDESTSEGQRGTTNENADIGPRLTDSSGTNIEGASTNGRVEESLPDQVKSQNYVIRDNSSVFTKGGKKTRYKANIAAIETLINILEEEDID